MKNKVIKALFIMGLCVIGCFAFSISTKAASIKSNTSKLSLNILNKTASYHKIKLTAKGADLPEHFYFDVNHHKSQTLISFGKWKGNTMSMTVRGNKTGYDLLEVSLVDDSTKDIIATYDIPVYVYKCWIETKHSVTVRKGKSIILKISLHGKKPDPMTLYDVKKGKHAKYKWLKSKGNKFKLRIKYRKKGKDKLTIQFVDDSTGGWILDEFKVKVKVKK